MFSRAFFGEDDVMVMTHHHQGAAAVLGSPAVIECSIIMRAAASPCALVC